MVFLFFALYFLTKIFLIAVFVCSMDFTKKTAVFKELAAHCKVEKRKWARVAFEQGWRSALLKASSTPVPTEQVVAVEPVEQVVDAVPVEQVVGRPEGGVVSPPRSIEVSNGGRPVPSLRACRVDLAPLTVPTSLSAGPRL